MSNVKKYRKKPVVIEALLWDGNNYVEFLRWSKFTPEQVIPMNKRPINEPDWKLVIPTLEGNMTAEVGDYIIKGVKSEFYPCKPDIFEATYEPVSPEADTQGIDLLTNSPDTNSRQAEAPSGAGEKGRL